MNILNTWEKALEHLRKGKSVKRADWNINEYIYKYSDCLFFSQNKGIVPWSEARNYPNHSDWILI